ncbi:PIG-L deacetylase family protein [Corynebacterium pacaense]|uniref:PIG-L deacetylase family protein n=1 Tax=Corynebacterium pacaense TaxID=1816684 RepID=UPI0009BC6FE7|nr:PIG-L deacetylase family protein [Corynebacterium pacaense]
MLVVVAHPDDPEYGLSAAVKHWTSAGVEVSYLLLTHGEAGISTLVPEETGPLRAAEQRAACTAVGVGDLVILNHPDSMLVYGLDLRLDIAREIRRVKPDAVVTASFEVEAYGGFNQADHRVAGLAALDATRDAGNPWAHRGLLGSEQPWNVDQFLIFGADDPNVGLPVSRGCVDAAIESLRCHSAYLAALPGHPAPEDLIPAALRGPAELFPDPGVEFAVNFTMHSI